MVDSAMSAHCHELRLCSICGEKLAPAERTFITGPSCVFGSDYGCDDPPMHEECAHYALRVCPHLIAPGSVSVVITALRYLRRYVGRLLVLHDARRRRLLARATPQARGMVERGQTDHRP
jgi:hypothetical protein